MILSFTIQNFKSILDIVLSTRFDEGKAPNGYENYNTHLFFEEKKERVMPILAIYGANASGKSNIIEAINSFQQLVLWGIEKVNFTPNKLNSKYSNTSFGVEFILNNSTYHYFISYNNKTIVEEKLNCNGKVVIHCLNQKVVETFKTNDIYKNRISTIYNIECQDTNGNQIFPMLLKLAKNYANLNKQVTNAFNYITKQIDIRLSQPYSKSISIRDLAQVLGSEEEALKKITELVKKFDIDIENMFYKKEEAPLQDIFFTVSQNEVVSVDRQSQIASYNQFYTEHRNTNKDLVVFNLQEESIGTQILIPVLGVILTTLEKGGVLFIDELDRSLHPLLLIQITRLFKDKRYNKKGAQLVFTLHCTDLLEDELVRKSEIGIVTKNKNDGSTFLKLSGFKNLRNTLDFRKRYLAGEFNGIPYPYI